MKIKILSVFFFLFCSVNSFAADYGDHDCNIFIAGATNVITGGWGNHYAATVVVKKAIVEKDFKKPTVVLNFSRQSNEWQTQTVQGTAADLGDRYLYQFEFPFGANDHSDTLELYAYISNGIDSLYDNNEGHNIILNSSSNWRYVNSRCEAP